MKKIITLLLSIILGWCTGVFAQTSTFFYTGAVQTYSVLPGVTYLGIDAIGACGGAPYNYCGSSMTFGVALGGRVQCDMTVTPGQVLYVYVGGSGQSDACNSECDCLGGWNGGQSTPTTYSFSSASGGASDIRTCNCAPTAINRPVVAGGGGGGGDYYAQGGLGGGLTGGAGNLSPTYGGGPAGAGGTQTGPGTGGGDPGSLGNGGAGTGYSPGSGGGGYWGGNGGVDVASGGGGSSYTDPVLCGSVTHTQGYSGASGNGVIRITILCTAGIITGITNVCAGSTSTLTDTIGASSGAWSSSNTAIVSIGAATGVITGVSAGTANITYSVTIPCGSVYSIATVTVNPLPSAITGATGVCLGVTTTLYDAATGGTWSSGSTGIAMVVSSTGVLTGAALGTSVITYTLPAGCSPATTTITVTSLSSPVTGATLICGGFTTTLSEATTGGTWSSGSASVASINITSGLVTGGSVSSVSTATITYTAAGGCTASTVVTVDPQPAPITGASSFCAGAITPLYDGGGGTWSSSNTAVATVGTSGIVAGITGGTATVTYTLAAGCNTTMLITVFPSPSVIMGPTGLCSGTTDTLTDSTAGGVWTSSNTSVAAIDPFLGIVTGGYSTGTATISYLSGSGCATTATVTVNVGPLPISGMLTLCPGGTTGLSDGVGSGSWSSGSTGIATVDVSGNVYGVSPGTAIISYTLGTCPVTAIVTVNASPPSVSGVTEICVGLATLLSDGITGGTWSSSNAAIASIVAASGILTGGSAGTATISYTLPDGCSATTTETVNTSPPPITGIAHVCPGAVTVLVDAGGGSWSSSNTIVATVGSTGMVSGVAPGTASIAYSIGTGCATSATITVNTLPAAISGIAILCAGSTTILSDGSGTWGSSSTGIATVSAGAGTVSGVAGGTAVITYTAASTGCSAHTIITVNPLPSAITGTLSVCRGATTSLNDLTTGGVWSSGSATIATISAIGTVTGLSPGTSVITCTAATGCSIHTTLTVNPLPLTITGTLSICAGASTVLLDATSGGLWTSAPGSTAIMSGGAGAVSGVSAGTAVVSYTLPTGCASTVMVTVNPLPAITGPTAECVGATIAEAGSMTGGTWSSTVPTVATANSTGIITGVATGTTVITYTSVAGCKATTTITVSLSPTGIIGASAVCAGDTTTLSDAVGGGVWSSSNTAGATVGSLNGTVMGVAVGTTAITYSLGTGCTVTKILTVNAAPDGITGITSVCVGATTALADATTGGVWSSGATGIATITSTGLLTGGTEGIDTITYTHGGCSVNTTVTVNLTPLAIAGMGSVCASDSIALSDAISGGVWSSASSGIASVDATGNVTGVSSATATITYSLGAGCAVTKIITVNPISAITGSMGMCLGTTTSLSDGTTGGTWTSGNTSVASINTMGLVTGVLTGTSTITYTTAAGCTATAIVTVNLAPSAISGTLHICVGSATTLGNTAGGGVWTSSNTAAAVVSVGAVVTGIAPGTTVITYSLGSGCTVTAVVTVDAVPLAIMGTMSICAGATTMLSEASTGGAWSSATGGIATVTSAGMVTAVSAGTVAVSYGFTTGCAATTMVTVNPIPAMITGTTHLCAGLTTALSSATTGGSWSSSSTSIATADPVLGVISGVAPGMAVITYVLPSGCSTSISVTINAVPAAITGGLAMCEGSGTALTDVSAGGLWSSGNSGVATVTGTGSVIGGILSGKATISYTVGGCAATVVVTVNSLPEPISSTSLCIGSTETLTDLPDGGTWSSSDAGIATINETEGVLTGVSAGMATIVYSLGGGCTVMTTVTVDASPGTIIGTPEVCVGYTTTLTDAAGSGVWSSGNTGIAEVSAGAVTGVAGGPATISYTSTSTGCAATRLVTVVAVPAISGVPIAIGMCAFSGVAMVSDAITGGTWTSASVTVSTAGVVTPHSAGAASLTYTIPLGCYVTASFSVNPLPGPVTGITRFCRGTTIALADTTADGIWSSSNSAVAPINTIGVVNGLSAGTAVISYVLSTGCMETEAITVDSFPVAGIITGLSSVCAGATTVLADLSVGGSWSSSNTFAGVLSGEVSGISAGVDTIKYTVSNTCGTASATKTITTYPLPIVYTVTGGGSYCAGSFGVLIGLSGSNTGVTYQLYRGATLSGSVTGTGIAADFGLQTAADVYTAVAVNAATGCSNNMLGSATVTITPAVIPVVNIATSTGDTICAGSAVTFTAAPLNGGSLPAYQWLVNNTLVPGVSGNLYTYTPVNGDEVKAMLISSAACAIPDTVSDSLIMAVVTPVIPTVTINASPGTNIQPGQSDTLTAIISGGGPSPAYQWEINGNPIAGATMASFTNNYSSNDTVTCIVSVGGICNSQGMDSVVILVSNVGVNILPTEGLLTIVPNPSNGTFTIKGSLGTTTDEEVSLEISDLLGQVIYNCSANAPGGNISAQVLLSSTIANGVYILRLASCGITRTYRVVVE